MASTLSSTQADPRFDSGAAPTMAKDGFTSVEEALAGLEEALASFVHQAVNDTPDARPRAPTSDRSADASISQSFAAARLGVADLGPRVPREQRSHGKRRPLARLAIAVCLGGSAIWAWRSYGGHARDMNATWAPPVGWISARPSADEIPAPQTPDPTPEQPAAPPTIETSAQTPAQAVSQAASIAQPATTLANEPAATSPAPQQTEMMARDLAALRQTVDQLAAGQEQLSREIVKLHAEKHRANKPPAEKPHKRMLRRVSALPAPPVAAPARKPPLTPMPPQAARQVSTVSPLSRSRQPAPQILLETQPSNPPPLRPPMPVPQP
jgi:hypothetical protein